MPRRRPLVHLSLLLGLASVALATLVIQRAGAESRAPAELASGQWQRLTQKITRTAETVGTPHSGASAEIVSGPHAAQPAAGASISSRPSQRPSREVLDRGVLELQAAEYDDRRPKSVVELQKFRRTYTSRIADGRGRVGTAELVNLNPRVNSWYLLRLTWDGEPTASFHLTNSRPETHDLILDSGFPGGLLLEDALAGTRCDLWSSDSPSSLAAANRLSTPYVTLCDDQIVLRRPTAGRRTTLEWATDLLRDNIWGGETLTVLVRDSLYSDAHLMRSELIAGAADPRVAAFEPGVPRPARVDNDHAGDLLVPLGLGLALESPRTTAQVGAWYAARDNPGVYVSVLQPRLIAKDVLESSPRLATGSAECSRFANRGCPVQAGKNEEQTSAELAVYRSRRFVPCNNSSAQTSPRSTETSPVVSSTAART